MFSVNATCNKLQVLYGSDSKTKAKKLVQKRINTGGDELQNQIHAGWVDVSCCVVLQSAQSNSLPALV